MKVIQVTKIQRLTLSVFLCRIVIIKNKSCHIIIQHFNGFISSFAEYITAFYLERGKDGQAANTALPT